MIEHMSATLERCRARLLNYFMKQSAARRTLAPLVYGNYLQMFIMMLEKYCRTVGVFDNSTKISWQSALILPKQVH